MKADRIAINLSILDFKQKQKRANRMRAITINLSILDFKPERRENGETYGKTINLSILDFKQRFQVVLVGR